MAKKVIGIPGWKIGDNSFGCGITYLDFISKFGDPCIIMPWEKEVKVDALLLPGGPDVTPSLYGQDNGYFTGNPCIHREGFFTRELDKYVKSGIPVFGICLGFQMLNVFFGGTITQNLHFHGTTTRYVADQEVTLAETPFHGSDNKYKVNSHHHQGVTLADLPKDNCMQRLAAVWNHDDTKGGVKNNNNIIEAFMHKELPIGGVQWHPEEILDGFAVKFFEYLLNNKKA